MLLNFHPLLRPANTYYLFLFTTYEIQVKSDGMNANNNKHNAL